MADGATTYAPVKAAPPKRAKPSKAASVTSSGKKGVLASLAADGIATFVFVFVSSIFSQLSGELEKNLGLPPAVAGLCILVAALITLDAFNNTFLGAETLNNPSNNIAFAAAGKGYFSVHLPRIVAQVLGGLLGAYAAIQYIPAPWQSDFDALSSGVKPGVSLWAGVACEAILAFLLNVTILYSLDTKQKSLGALAPLLVTIVLVIAGAELTGPSMNPAWSFSWYYFLQGHDRLQHIAVFWAAPLGGALAAGLLWHALTAPASQVKRRKAAAKAGSKATKKTQ